MAVEDQRLTLDNILSLLIKNANDEGEIPAGIKGINILYNALTGQVKLREVEQKEHINNVFSESAFQAYLLPVQQAICWLAKQYLLIQLYNLNEPRIRNLIDKNHQIDIESGKIHANDSPGIEKRFIRESDMDIMLEQIQKYTSPHTSMSFKFFSGTIGTSQELKIQHAIHVAFIELNGFDKIKSKDDAISVMEKIKNLSNLPLEMMHKSNKSA